MDSEYEVASNALDIEEENESEGEIIEEKKPEMKMKKPITPSKEMSSGRKWWLCLTYASTWCYCPFCLDKCGKMKRKDVQIHGVKRLLSILLSSSFVFLYFSTLLVSVV